MRFGPEQLKAKIWISVCIDKRHQAGTTAYQDTAAAEQAADAASLKGSVTSSGVKMRSRVFKQVKHHQGGQSLLDEAF